MPARLRIEIFPSDLDRMIRFYSDVLGFHLVKHQGNYAYLNRDDIFIGAIEVASAQSVEQKAQYRQPTQGIEIVIEVDDLERERDHIVGNGWKLEADIQSQAWGLRDFRILDPDGYYLRITTHSPNRDGKGFGTG